MQYSKHNQQALAKSKLYVGMLRICEATNCHKQYCTTVSYGSYWLASGDYY